MEDLFFGGLLLGLCFYTVRAWFRWFRCEPKLVAPVWRSSITVFGFGSSTISLACVIFLVIYASISSSLTPYHPTALLIYRTICVTSLTAIIAGIVGEGPLETPTFVCSVVCLVILLITGFAS